MPLGAVTPGETAPLSWSNGFDSCLTCNLAQKELVWYLIFIYIYIDMTGIHHWIICYPFFVWVCFKQTFASFRLSGSKVELVLDLSFTAGHQGDTLASAWAVTDGKGEPIGPRMVLEVVHLGLHKNWENLEMFLLAVCCQHVIFQSEQYIYIYIPAGKFPIRSRVLSVIWLFVLLPPYWN